MRYNFFNSSKTTLLIGGSLIFTAQMGSAQIPADSPNFLIIMTDQQAWNAVGYSGNQLIKTPNLDRLARTTSASGSKPRLDVCRRGDGLRTDDRVVVHHHGAAGAT